MERYRTSDRVLVAWYDAMNTFTAMRLAVGQWFPR